MRALAVVYLLAQGVVTLAWWAWLWAQPDARSWFRPDHYPDSYLLAFAGPDAVLLAGASFVAAAGIWSQRPWGFGVLLVVAGACAYAGLYTISVSLMTGQAWLAAALMTPVAVIPAALAWWLRR
jgi:hypothetical protein